MAESSRIARPAIKVTRLKKSFGEQLVLQEVDFEVAQTETVAVLGKSGTGKSVLLKLLIGLHDPDSGSIEIQGQEITSLELRELNEIRKKVGFLFQHAALYDSLTVEQNVAFPLKRHMQLSQEELRQKVSQLLERVGMEGAASKMPAEISGGMQKRVGLARALALEPEILLFDEPTAGLDPITASEINQLILGLQRERGTSSVLVTHDVRSARTVPDRIMMLHEGMILFEGDFESFRASRDEVVAKFSKEAV